MPHALWGGAARAPVQLGDCRWVRAQMGHHVPPLPPPARMTEDGVCPGCGLCSGMSLALTVTWSVGVS